MQIIFHVERYRNEQNLTTRGLAELCGISKTQISKIEGDNANPTVYTLCMIAKGLNVSPYSLFEVKY